MKKNSSGIIWGLLLILAGIFIAGKAMNIFYFNIFFDGWWTLFIIIPCFIGFFSSNDNKTSNGIGLFIGLFLLMWRQHFISWSIFLPLCFAGICVIIGTGIIFGNGKTKKKLDDDAFTIYHSEHNTNNGNTNSNYQKSSYTSYEYPTNDRVSNESNAETVYKDVEFRPVDSDTVFDRKETEQESGKKLEGFVNQSDEYSTENKQEQRTTSSSQDFYKSTKTDFHNEGSSSGGGAFSQTNMSGGHCVCSAVLSSKELRYDNEIFRGAMISAILGGIELDLRRAIIEENVKIDIKVVLGGIEVFVPNYVRVVVNSNPILGGVDNKTLSPSGANPLTPTVFINATCVLGGVDVK